MLEWKPRLIALVAILAIIAANSGYIFLSANFGWDLF
jgi:hypothetical protein